MEGGAEWCCNSATTTFARMLHGNYRCQDISGGHCTVGIGQRQPQGICSYYHRVHMHPTLPFVTPGIELYG